MSAEEETGSAGDGPAAPQDVPGETPAKEPAAKAPAIRKRALKRKAKADAAAPGDEKKPAAKKPPRVKRPAAKAEPAADGEESSGAEEAAKAPVAAKEPAKPARKPARRAGGSGKQAPRRRVVRAHARYVRTSARKARMVCGHLRGKSVQEARAILAFTPREVARDWSKLLESAVANAESNHELLEDDLIVREAYADEGPTIKRFRPRAMGRATPIRKRTSHLTITLTPGPEPGTNKRQS